MMIDHLWIECVPESYQYQARYETFYEIEWNSSYYVVWQRNLVAKYYKTGETPHKPTENGANNEAYYT